MVGVLKKLRVCDSNDAPFLDEGADFDAVIVARPNAPLFYIRQSVDLAGVHIDIRLELDGLELLRGQLPGLEDQPIASMADH